MRLLYFLQTSCSLIILVCVRAAVLLVVITIVVANLNYDTNYRDRFTLCWLTLLSSIASSSVITLISFQSGIGNWRRLSLGVGFGMEFEIRIGRFDSQGAAPS